MTAPVERSIPELFSDALGQLAKLVGNEFALARAELSAKVNQAMAAAAMIAAGAVVLIPALVILLMALAEALVQRGFSSAVAYLIAGGGALAVAVVLMLIGVNRLSADALKPKVTLEQVRQDKVAAKEMMR
jgi:uncharacterized membrane protein YgcG